MGHKDFEGDLTRSRFLLVSKFVLLDFHDLTAASKNLLAMAPPARFGRTISPVNQPGSQQNAFMSVGCTLKIEQDALSSGWSRPRSFCNLEVLPILFFVRGLRRIFAEFEVLLILPSTFLCPTLVPYKTIGNLCLYKYVMSF